MKNRIGRITIAGIFALGIAILAVTQVPRLFAEPLDIHHTSWKLVRETADEDGASFAAVYNLTTSGNFASKDSATVANGGPFRIPTRPGELGTEGWSPGTRWMFAICGKNYNNVDDTFSFNIVGWGKTNGMLQNIAEGDGVLGTQAVVVYPDGGDALGELVSETSVVYTHASTKFTVTNAAFDGVVAGMQAYVTGTNITSGYYQVTAATDANNIECSGITASNNNTDSTVQINPSFWADTINIDETTKWPRDGDANNVTVYNSGDNEVAFIVIETTGLDWIQFVVYAADAATNEEAGGITVYGRPF